MSTSSTFPALLERFFVQRLMGQKRVSPETVAAYRDTFRLLLSFAQSELSKSPSALTLEDLDAPFVCRFLDHLEEERHNSPRTRNHRLAAIRSFFRYAALEEPALADHIHRVLAIPSKRWTRPGIDFLTVAEAEAILGGIDTSSWCGRRDFAMLSLALHTGLRASELTSLRYQDVAPGPGAHIRCHGKGRKERAIPLGKETARSVAEWLRERAADPAQALFPNRRGGRLSRDGVAYILHKHVANAQKRCPSLRRKRVSPHVLRHTTAVHLLQAGADLSLIALWLGHESVASAQAYIDSDLEYKRRILGKTIRIRPRSLAFRPDDELMAFLQSL